MIATRLAGAAAIAVAAILLTGCAPSVPDAEPVAEVDCASTVASGRIPAGFDPVAVYVCDSLGGFEDSAGRWSATTMQRLEGDLGALVDAFGEGSDPRWPGPCPAIGFIVPDVWLVDAAGAAIRLAYPVTGCNAPKTERIDAALADLTVVDEQHLNAQLQESAAALAAGCSTRGEVLRIVTNPGLEVLDPEAAPSPDPAWPRSPSRRCPTRRA